MRVLLPLVILPLISCAAVPISNAGSEHNYYCARYLAAGDLERAQNRCEMALEFGAGYAEPHNLLGQIEMKAGNFDAAEEHFKRAIALKADFAEAYSNLGALKQKQSDYHAARDLYHQALEVDPTFQVARLNLGVVQRRLGELAEARSSFWKCLEYDPSQCECLLGLGAVMAQQDSLPEARMQYERASKQCRHSAEAARNLCWANLQLGELGAAQVSCLDALSIDPNHLEARALYDTVRQELTKREALLRSYAKKLRETPRSPEPRFRLCLAHEKFGQLVEASEWCDEAIALAPDHAGAHFHAARIAERLLDGPKTIGHCQRVLSLRSSTLSARSWCTSRVRSLGG